MPSADRNAFNPFATPPRALYLASGGQSRLASLNGVKLCVPSPRQTILFCFEPSRPRWIQLTLVATGSQ